MRKLLPWLALLSGFAWQGAQAAPELTLTAAIDQALKASPQVASQKSREVATQSQIGVAKSGYLPHLEVDAVDTTGFPGSTGALGLMGIPASPFRVGAGAGIAAKVPIWDFGRTSSQVEEAKHEALGQKYVTSLTRLQIADETAHAFYDCALVKSQQVIWNDIADSAKLIEHEVDRFVRTGQRSIVERYLSASQTEDAQTKAAAYGERLRLAKQRLGVLMQVPEQAFECPLLPETMQEPTGGIPPLSQNPAISLANEREAAARAGVSYAKSDYLPKLLAIGTLGVTEDVRLVGRKDYSVGVALSLPVFDGFRTVHQVDEARALEISTNKDIDAEKQSILDQNAKYDEILASGSISMKHLSDEITLAMQGFKTAKSRYFSLQGSVVDLREALRNLSRTKTELNDLKAQYLTATADKAFLNGQLPTH